MPSSLAAVNAIGDRAQALESLAPQLSPEQLAEALVAVKTIGDEQLRAHTLEYLAPYVAPTQYAAALLNSLVEVAARLPRNQALAAISASLQISEAHGGPEVLESIHRAISDTARWYP